MHLGMRESGVSASATRSYSSAPEMMQSFALDDTLDDYELPTFTQGPAAPKSSPPAQVRGRVGLPEVSLEHERFVRSPLIRWCFFRRRIKPLSRSSS